MLPILLGSSFHHQQSPVIKWDSKSFYVSIVSILFRGRFLPHLKGPSSTEAEGGNDRIFSQRWLVVAVPVHTVLLISVEVAEKRVEGVASELLNALLQHGQQRMPIWIWLHCYSGVCVRKFPIPGCKPWFLKRYFWKKRKTGRLSQLPYWRIWKWKDDAILPRNLIKKRLSIPLKLKRSPLKSSALYNEHKWRNEIIHN